MNIIKKVYNWVNKLIMLSRQLVLNNVSSHKVKEWEKLEKILLTTTLSILGGSGIFFTGKGNILKHTGFLGFSWMFLSLSLVALLLSYLFSELSTSDLMKKLKSQPEQFTEEEFKTLFNKNYVLWVKLTNYTSLVSTIVGIILLIIFAYLNII